MLESWDSQNLLINQATPHITSHTTVNLRDKCLEERESERMEVDFNLQANFQKSRFLKNCWANIWDRASSTRKVWTLLEKCA